MMLRYEPLLSTVYWAGRPANQLTDTPIVDPVICAVVPEPDRDCADDAVPLAAAEVVGDLLGDQDRPRHAEWQSPRGNW